MFEARSITVQIGARKIIEDVSLSLKPGETIALLGANGAGKSTLLRAMCGDVGLQAGSVQLDGRDLRDWNFQELARKRAVLSQHTSLNFPFTAREVALLGRNPHIFRGGESAKDLQIVDEALNRVEAAHLAEQTFPTLSGGEQQRVHLARILAQIWEAPASKHGEPSARYLLLDEPTSSLDPAHQHLTLRLARALSRSNTGVLVVLHDLNLAAVYADRIFLLKDGKVYKSGAPREILTAENIKDVFDFDVSILEHRGLPLVVADAPNYY